MADVLLRHNARTDNILLFFSGHSAVEVIIVKISFASDV